MGECGFALKDVTAVACSSVVPAFSRILQAAFLKWDFYLINRESPFSYEVRASHVGMDRLVNAEAAIREYGTPCLVLDMGTCTTLCAISRAQGSKAVFLGGAIFPGIEMGLQGLATRAAQLSSIELTPPAKVIGENTQEALRSGILLGYASMLEGMVKRFKTEMAEGAEIPVIATGGAAHLLKGLTDVWTVLDLNLTLKGIAQLYETLHKR